MTRKIGTHIRVNHAGSELLTEVVHKALRLGVDFFQCFVTVQATGKLIPLYTDDVAKFRALCEEHFPQRYLHTSYWSNLCSAAMSRHYVLEREIVCAKKLGFTHLILHPGSAKDSQDKTKGIDILARSLNAFMKKEPGLTFILENTAHGNFAVGSDIEDFARLLEKLDQPERILFCFDTAHAYVYGYDFVHEKTRAEFIQLLDQAVGHARIALLHVNDTYEPFGSKADRHAAFTDGLIGERVLREMVNHPAFCHLPMMPELPVITEEQEALILQKMRSW